MGKAMGTTGPLAMSLAMLLAWLGGIVLATGWWKAVAAFFPPYAIYLVVEKLMQINGII